MREDPIEEGARRIARAFGAVESPPGFPDGARVLTETTDIGGVQVQVAFVLIEDPPSYSVTASDGAKDVRLTLEGKSVDEPVVSVIGVFDLGEVIDLADLLDGILTRLGSPKRCAECATPVIRKESERRAESDGRVCKPCTAKLDEAGAGDDEPEAPPPGSGEPSQPPGRRKVG